MRKSTDELFDFRRIFMWLLGLVVLPTLLLSGFGILAIKNERAAIEKRLQDAYAEKVKHIEQELLDWASRTDASTLDAAALNTEVEEIANKAFPKERAHFVVVPKDVPVDGGGSISELLRGMAPGFRAKDLPVSGESRSSPVYLQALPEPLDAYQLGAFLPGIDPIGEATFRNTLIYSTLMGIFLALVIFGVVLTARFVHREMKLSQLQTDFVSNISHELRTPLTSIRMFIETLQMDRVRDEEELRECLTIIAEESERLTRMIERILGWARMEAGRRIYRMKTTPVEEIIDETMTAFRTQGIQSRVEIERHIDPDLPSVHVDSAAITEAILNLLNNALKYTGREKKIKIKAYRHKGMVAIEVIDNGIGIGAIDRKRIFDRFYRADALLSRKTEGSGLGLTIVRHIVEAHGGRILVDSEVGEGSRFTILLPVESRLSRAA